jgi:hypothetical protein
MKEFVSILLGNATIPMFCALFFYALLGVIIKLLIHATTRDPEKGETPNKFSIKFLFKDNWKRLLLSIILVYVVIRFLSQFLIVDVTNNPEIHLFGAIVVGFSCDSLSEWFKSKVNALRVDRDKIET